MILITMAGKSQRFFDAGYQIEKFMLPLGGSTVFDRAISSFRNYFQSEKFIFAIRSEARIEEFVKKSAENLGIIDFEIIHITYETKGQAETAYLALRDFDNDFSLTIFNIDTVHNNYTKPTFEGDCDGYLEVFSGSGYQWSFIEPDIDNKVIRTTEKIRISDLCSTGLYFFQSKRDFCNAFIYSKANGIKQMGEYYIAPLYNELIKNRKTIKYRLSSIGEIEFCGTPAEYEQLNSKLTNEQNNH
jgi:hypothetical protein